MVGYHVSTVPDIRKFKFSKSGSGFGTNFYGSGLYVALDEEPVRKWAKEMEEAGLKPYLYEVEIPDSANIIEDEDKFWDVVAMFVPEDSEEPEPGDLRKASRYMVDKLGVDGLKYWNHEDGNSIVLWNPSMARVVSCRPFGERVDEAAVSINGGDSVEFEYIDSLEDLAYCNELLATAKRNKSKRYKNRFGIDADVWDDVMDILATYLPAGFKWNDRLDFLEYLSDPKDLYNKCKKSFDAASNKILSDARFIHFYKKLARVRGSQSGKYEYIFPVFFKNVTSIGTHGNGDLVCKEGKFDVKGFQSSSFGLQSHPGMDIKTITALWKDELGLPQDAEDIEVAFAQLERNMNTKNLSGVIFIDELGTKSIILKPEDVTPANREKFYNLFEVKNKGGYSEGMAMTYNGNKP